MRTVGNFNTEDPARLTQQLDQFQKNADAETTDIRKTFSPGLQPLKLVATGATATRILPTLSTGLIALCETALGSLQLILSPPVDGAPGFAAFVKKQTVNSITLMPAGQSAPGIQRTINSAATKAYGAGVIGLFYLYFDGSNWWAAP